MWHTSRGDRTLVGDEAALIGRAIDEMISALVMRIHDDFEEEASDCATGISVYDSCTASQRIALLHQVASFLLCDTTEPLPLNALTDATVAALFVEVRDQVAIEIRLGRQPLIVLSGGISKTAQSSHQHSSVSWREMVLLAHQACFDCRYDCVDTEDEVVVLDRECEELPEWELLINELSESILWDRDFELAEGFLDLDPGVSKHRRRLLGIDDHYFSAVPNDPDTDLVFDLAEQAYRITRAKPR